MYQPQNKKGPSCISLLSLQFLFGFHVPFLVGCTALSAHSYGRLLLLELALGPYRNLGVRGFSAPWPIHIFCQDKGFLHVDGFLGMPGTPPVSEAAVLGFYESLHLFLHRGLKANFPLTIIMRATQSIQAMLKPASDSFSPASPLWMNPHLSQFLTITDPIIWAAKAIKTLGDTTRGVNYCSLQTSNRSFIHLILTSLATYSCDMLLPPNCSTVFCLSLCVVLSPEWRTTVFVVTLYITNKKNPVFQLFPCLKISNSTPVHELSHPTPANRDSRTPAHGRSQREIRATAIQLARKKKFSHFG